MVEKLKTFVTTNKTNKTVYLALGVPFLAVTVMVYMDRADMADWLAYMNGSFKWVLMTFLGGGAAMKGAASFGAKD